MIGFYDYTVIITYLSMVCSVFGMTMAIQGHYSISVACLAISGLLDMFDGKVARTKKNRTDDEKLFGVQIDSLCDIVCFGVFPAIILFSFVGKGILTWLIMSYYCLCSLIRLAYFNVLETRRQQVEDGANKFYHGLPITSISIALPIVSIAKPFATTEIFSIILIITMLLVGTLFVVDFKLKKPNNIKLCILVAITAVAVILTLAFTHYYRNSENCHKDNKEIISILNDK